MSQPLSESIHPRLKAALGCLDVQLEQELMLYSAQQHSNPHSVSELSPSASQENHEPQYFGHFESEPSVAAPLNFEASSSQTSPTDSVVNREIDPGMEPLAAASELMESSLFSPTDEAEPLLSPPDAEVESDLSPLFPSMLSEEEHDQNPHHQKELQELTRPLGNPDDYLASSEALLRNLRKTQPKAERHWLSPLFTPWGMATGLGVILTLVGINLMFNSGLQQRLRLATQPPNGNSPSQPPPVAEKRPPQEPDLTAQEFQDVNLSNLSRLQPSASPANSGSKVQPNSLQPGKIQPGNPQPSKITTSSIQKLGPIPAPSATTIPRLEGAPAGNDNFFFVISNYTGQPSLDQAQKGFPSAYVVNFREGARIQFGAFDDLKSAENLVNTLKNRGIAATVRKPRQPS